MQINNKFIMSIKYPHMKIKFKIIYGSDDDEDQSFKITCQRAKDKYQNKYSHMQINTNTPGCSLNKSGILDLFS